MLFHYFFRFALLQQLQLCLVLVYPLQIGLTSFLAPSGGGSAVSAPSMLATEFLILGLPGLVDIVDVLVPFLYLLPTGLPFFLHLLLEGMPGLFLPLQQVACPFVVIFQGVALLHRRTRPCLLESSPVF